VTFSQSRNTVIPDLIRDLGFGFFSAEDGGPLTGDAVFIIVLWFFRILEMLKQVQHDAEHGESITGYGVS